MCVFFGGEFGRKKEGRNIYSFSQEFKQQPNFLRSKTFYQEFFFVVACLGMGKWLIFTYCFFSLFFFLFWRWCMFFKKKFSSSLSFFLSCFFFFIIYLFAFGHATTIGTLFNTRILVFRFPPRNWYILVFVHV